MAGILGGVCGLGALGGGGYLMYRAMQQSDPEPVPPGPTEEISLSKTSDSIDLLRNDKLTVNNLPSGATVAWSSENDKIATVDNNGNVKGIKTGETNIVATVTTNGTKTLKCKVTIKMPEPTVHNNIKYHYVEASGKEQAHYEVYLLNGTHSEFDVDYLVLASKYSGKDDTGTDRGELPVTGMHYINETTGAFSDCTNLKTVILHEGFKAIGPSAFAGCTNLENIYIPDTLTTFDTWCFNNTAIKPLTLSENVSTFKEVFYGGENTKIEYVDFSKSNVTTLFESTFMYCHKLKTVKLNSNVTDIPKNFFYGCDSLENFDMPANIQSIGETAFRNCSSLTKISLGASLNSVYNNPFEGCTNLATFDVDSANTYFKSSDDKKYLIRNSDKTLVSYPSIDGELVIPSEIEIVGDSAFTLSNISSVTFNSNVKEIGNEAFSFCKSLTDVTFDNTCSVTQLPAKTFLECASLKKVVLHEGLVSIGNETFSKCAAIVSLNIPSTVTSIGYSMLYECSSTIDPDKITYPDGATYKITDEIGPTVISTSFNPNDGKASALSYFDHNFIVGQGDHRYKWDKN